MATAEPTPAVPRGEPTQGQGLILLALLVALTALAGSLYLSLGMQLKACPLCLYQRTFVMGALGVLLMGPVAGVRQPGLLSVLALPAAMGGAAVVGFHVFLEATGALECPAGVFGVGSAPQQAAAALSLLALLLAADALRAGRHGGTLAALALGVVFAYADVKSAPPPKQPTAPYTDPLDVCRPPYRPAETAR
jgi:disulfide bond formation protein DsbB